MEVPLAALTAESTAGPACEPCATQSVLCSWDAFRENPLTTVKIVQLRLCSGLDPWPQRGSVCAGWDRSSSAGEIWEPRPQHCAACVLYSRDQCTLSAKKTLTQLQERVGKAVLGQPQSSSRPGPELPHSRSPESTCCVSVGACSFFPPSCPTPPCLLLAHCEVLFMRECFQEHSPTTNSALSE